jgi:hypothetical protein
MRVVMGSAALALFFWLGCIRKIEPFFTYFYFFAWGPYLWTVYRSERHVLWLLALSTTVWLVFEAFNFRLQNWSYIGLPPVRWIRWPGYALSFSTVMPGILWTARLFAEPSPRGAPVPHPAYAGRGQGPVRQTSGGRAGRSDEGWVFCLGFALVLLALLWPRLFFPLVWGGIFFLAEPYVQNHGGHSLIADWRAGQWRTTGALLLSGLICGVFWEFCNYWAGSKWVYHLPYWNFGRVFEMPVLGFIGFPAFALEVYILYEAARLFWQKAATPARIVSVAAMLIFWIGVFYGIDRWTVTSLQLG